MRESGNINFVLIGAKATGKTVYLASLYLNIKNITSQNEHTIEYLKPLANQLLDKEYPQATAGNLHELMFDYKDDNFVSHIQIDDVDGYFIESMHKSDEATQKQRDTLLRNIKLSEGIIFFFPFEKEFNEASIRNFNYEVDTFISKLREMYKDRETIPIPSVIAVSKWDSSLNYKASNENDSALEYIEKNKFLRLAKEKIELHFSNVKIIPISSIGKDFDLNTYNIDKPIKFFLEETYAIWEEKIEKLSSNKEELLKFLSKINFDMKFYKDGKYVKQYDEIECEFATKYIAKYNQIENYDAFMKEYETDSDIIKSIKPENRQKLELLKEKLEDKKNKKKSFLKVAVVIPLVLSMVGGVIWYKNKNTEDTILHIYSNYKNKNYKKTLDYIKKYKNSFTTFIDNEHKKNIETIQSKIEHNYDEIFSQFRNSLSKLNISDSIVKVENEWSNIFLSHKTEIINLLNKKYNDEFLDTLNKMPMEITEIDDLVDLENKLKNIEKIKQKISFSNETENLEIFSENSSVLQDRRSLYDRYVKVLDNGVPVNRIIFGDNSKDQNSVFGFDCISENQLIVTINGTKYNYESSVSCNESKMSWISSQTFKLDTKYNVQAIEKDLVENDEFSFWFKLNPNNLIKMYNNEYFKIDIEHCFIGFGES